MGDVNKEIGLYPMSGDVVRFVSTAKLPIGGFETEWTPEQDLHGYEYPWPAGGGKNLLNVENSETGGIDASGNPATGDTLWRGNEFIPITAGETYTFSININYTVRLYFYASDQTFISPRYQGTKSVAAVAPENAVFAKWSLYTSSGGKIITMQDVVSWQPQLEKGTERTSYQPYSNICPITGKDSVTIYVSPTPDITDETVVHEIVFPVQGYNQWDEVFEYGYYDVTNGKPESSTNWKRSKNFIKCKPSTTYFFYKTTEKTASVGAILYYTADKTFISAKTSSFANYTFTTPDNCYFMMFYMSQQYDIGDISINYPSTETGYYPYKGRTVYGGTLTINEDGSGKLVVTRYGFIIDENIAYLNISSQTDSVVVYDTSLLIDNEPSHSSTPKVISNRFSTAIGSGKAGRMVMLGQHVYLVINKDDLSEISSAGGKQWFGQNPTQIIYEVVNPIEYNLTVDQIKTLIGYNYVWNTGGATNITFQYYTGGEGMAITFLDCWTYPKAKLDEMFKAVTDRLDALEEAADDSDAKTTLLEAKEKATEDVAEEEGDE